MRLDEYLFSRGLAENARQAAAFVMAGRVYVNDVKAEKPGDAVPANASVTLREQAAYVSRGGLKLEKALREFGLSPAGKVCMDIGASTGGFTDCMLQNGAARVYAVDVAYGMLAWKLRGDARVVNMERTNIRRLTPGDLPEAIAFFSVDVSFISLGLVLPVAAALCAPGADGVCLVKPQFEAAKGEVGKKGVVRSAAVHAAVLQKAADNALQNGFSPCGTGYSPITGPEGNVEFLLHVKKEEGGMPLPPESVTAVVAAAHAALLEGGSQP